MTDNIERIISLSREIEEAAGKIHGTLFDTSPRVGECPKDAQTVLSVKDKLHIIKGFLERAYKSLNETNSKL